MLEETKEETKESLIKKLETANGTINNLMSTVQSQEEKINQLSRASSAYRDALLCLAKEIN